MSGLLFITANGTYKVANLTLLELRDIEYDAGDCQHLVLSKTATNLDQTGYRENLPTTTAGSLTKETFDDMNEWLGARIEDIEKFILAEAQKSEHKDEPALFLVLDDQGQKEKSIIIAERNLWWLSEDEDEEDEEMPRYDFHKARFPWDEAYSAWCNLNISNVSFEELCDEEEGPDESGWWKVLSKEESGMEGRSKEEKAKRERLEKQFADEGKI